ncbi:cytochrome P450 [Mycobacterium sp. 236(2023)]|uniref:cytochrome P450 n=1 Tax=Mycobacterium sp. 236(2023) TaxID=3038163 RepID=UPI002415388B|nr:cytochrome P450 [Mycobacterium sp. 236(2023)]MDG4668043.1 cytochrome P450 [Mycobacterium sp. 236(2023)]
MSHATELPRPDHIPAELVRHFDFTAGHVLDDPYQAFDRLRDDGDIVWSPMLGQHWIVLSADLVREAFQTPDVFSSYPTGVPAMTEFWPRKLIPQELDGAAHVRYRRLLSPFFSPSAVRPMADAVTRRATALIEAIAEEDEIEFIRSVALPLPSSVFLDLFGLPLERADMFTTWTDQLLHSGDPQVSAEVGRMVIQYLIGLIAEKRANPEDDLISALTTAVVEDSSLTDDEILDIAFLFFIAGLDTVTSQLGVMFYHLSRDIELQQRLRASPELVPAAVEEMLRAYPIVPPARTLTRDHVLGGVHMKAGDTVLLATSAASRDPRLCENPQQVDVDRPAVANPAFGLGPHRCIGSHLARQELSIALQLMLEMMPEFRLAAGCQPKWHTAGNVWGIDQLRLAFGR